MQNSDVLAIILAVIGLGGGALMSTFSRGIIRTLGAGLMVLGVAGLIFWFGYYRNASAEPPSGGVAIGHDNNGNVCTSGATCNFGPPSQPHQTPDSGVIKQAGVAVGKVFGGRRSPNDATVFEFKEITNSDQFNPKEPFTYEGTRLIFLSNEGRSGLTIGRIQDGKILSEVRAKVIE